MTHSKSELDFRKEKPLYKKGNIPFSIKELQTRIRKNKIKHGFSIDDPWQDFAYLMGEIGEMAEGVRNPEREDVIEAMVDMCILSLGLYALYKVDGYQYIVRKMIVNEKRKYKKRGRHYNIRVDREEKTDLSKVEVPKNMTSLTLKQLQARIMKNKIRKGFNLDPKKIEIEYVCLSEEISEMFMALRKGNKEEFLEALTDLFIYLVGLFGIFKLDSYELITQKIALNEKRVYQRSKSGHLVRKNQL